MVRICTVVPDAGMWLRDGEAVHDTRGIGPANA